MKITIEISDSRANSELLTQINRKLQIILERTLQMATQADIDAIVAQITALGGTLTTALNGIRQDIADLKVANPGVDTTALETSVNDLATAVAGASELDSENPVTPTA
jgi:hypothetical protein